MDIERTKLIFLELGKLVIDLPKDPASFGPDFLREQISVCRNYLNHASFYLQEVMQEQHLIGMDLEDKKAAYQVQSDELLANNLQVKNLPHIEDRQAMINVLQSRDFREIQRLEREVLNLKHVEKVVRHRLKELDNTMSAIRLQRSLLRDQIRVGSGYGDETETSRKNIFKPDEIDNLDGDELSRLIDETEAEAAGTADSVLQFGEETEDLTPQPLVTPRAYPSLEAHPTNGLLCSDCGEPQYITSSGAVCKNGHGEALGVQPASKQKTAKTTPDPDQDLLDELDDLISDGDDGQTTLTTTPVEAELPQEDKLKAPTGTFKADDIDEDMHRFLTEDEEDLDALIGDI